MTQEGEAGSAAHLPFEVSDLGVSAFDRAILLGRASPATTAGRYMRRPWRKPRRAGRSLASALAIQASRAWPAASRSASR